MNETLLTWIVFILAFGGMVLIHEFGHFIVARLCGIEVEEFGVGLPTPGALNLWTSKGYLILKDGRRVEIPYNFRLPLNSSDLIGREVKITVDQVDEKWVLRSMQVVVEEPAKTSGARSPLEMQGVYVDENGKVIDAPRSAQAPARKVLKAGKLTGATVMDVTLAEVHPGTRFTFNWLPLGGFVRPKGENDPSIPGGLAAANPWKRLAVLVAGPLMNLLTAMLIYSFIVVRGGIPIPSQIRITDIVPNSPAAAAGIQKDDVLLAGQGTNIVDYEDLRNVIGAHENSPVTFTVLRDGQQLQIPVTPQRSPEDNRVVIGIYFEQRYTSQPATLGSAIEYGALATGNAVRTLISLPAQLIRGTLPAEQGRIIGLKGIYDIMEQSVSNDMEANNTPAPTTAEPKSNPFDNMTTLMIVASLSVSLGVFNLVPFPALDGGRILFILPELIFRRRVSPRIENLVHGIGMAVLLIFMLYVNVMDFVNPIAITIP